jgi:hypothetical protein
MLLSGCEMLREQVENDKEITSECTYVHPDGTTMSCRHNIVHDQEGKVEGASLDMPIPAPVP